MNKLAKKNVLLVEDDPAIRALVANVLEEANLRVIKADRGKKALAILEEPDQPINLVILDMNLPDIQGREVLTQIRLKGNIPVIVCSGDLPLLKASLCGDFEKVTVLKKPYSIKELLQAVDQNL